MIKGIGHTAYVVEDMERSLDFYCGVLGFKQAFELKDNADKPWIVYIQVAGLQFIELFYGGQHRPEPQPRQIGFNHLCLEVEDIQQIAAHLRERGVTLDALPQQGKDRNWQCWARDPDGNRIEFMQLDPESPQVKSAGGRLAE
ncbi:VOC family protein [Paenibacillus sp. IB182496]|uniref:VOC family protein n=1 Tax=Paenibacillus sabuli TaxID=2772509 RepID=A0A927GQZ6_9BACL|nr:VOC family protein [Paenibacillus sabuli]MBD2844786.1 VOC family protein [Paenibacillus sabuli]